MIQIEKESIGEIPVLHVVKAELHHKSLPTVIYYHGFRGEKISSLTLAYKIAAEGYRVVLPDSIYHGDRNQNVNEAELDMAFWDIVSQNITELKELKHHLVRTGKTEEGRIGIGGTSMGAITTYGALCTYDWIKAGVSLMGTAYMVDYAEELIQHVNATHKNKITTEQKEAAMKQIEPLDLTLAPEKLRERPLLIWHGEEDEVVPYAYSPALYDKIKGLYANKEKIHFISEPGRAHNISRLSMDEATKWFVKYI